MIKPTKSTSTTQQADANFGAKHDETTPQSHKAMPPTNSVQDPLSADVLAGSPRGSRGSTRRQSSPGPGRSTRPSAQDHKRPKLWLRTREKERFKMQNLELDVMQLRQEIHRLQTLQQMANSRLLMGQQAEKQSLMLLVQNYYKTFKHGFQKPVTSKKPWTTTDRRDPRQDSCVAVDHEAFLRKVMDVNVSLGRFRGVDFALEQWRRYSEFVDFCESKLLSAHFINTENSPIIRTRGEFKIRLTRRSVQELFPHMVGNKAITKKLVGLRLHLQGSVVFYFSPRGKIIRLEVVLSFVETFAKLFRDPKELLALVEHAKISQDSFLGQLPWSHAAFVGTTQPDESFEERGQAPLQERDALASNHARQMDLAHILS